MSTTTLSYHGDEKALPAWQVTGMSVRCNNNVTGGCNLTGRIATS